MKRTIILFILLIIIPNISIGSDDEVIKYEKDELEINNFLNETEQYSKTGFENIDYNKIFEESISGNVDTGFIFETGYNLLGKEVKSAINTLGTILIIIIIHSILKTISESLGNESTGKIAYFVQFILIVIVLMKSYNQVIGNIIDTINLLTDFTYMLIPLLISLVIASGNMASGGIIQPVILFSISFIGRLITSIIIPVLVVSTVLGIVSNLSDDISVSKLSKYFKSSIVWVLGIILTIFTGILSLETSLTKGVDQISLKTSKAAISGAVPVVGKILGDTVETVLGCTGIIKNSIGFIGVIGVIGICILPVIRVRSINFNLLYCEWYV